MIQIFSLSRCLIATSLVLTLFGCGGDESESNTPPPIEVFPIAAIDGFSTAKPEKTTHIDLTPYIRGGDAKLVSVQGRAAYSAMETCAEPVLNGVGFDVVASTGTLCDYQFTVKNAQTRASARMTILATVADIPMLPPLSRAMMLSDGEITLDIATMLGSSVYPDGYSIKSVSVQGGDDNLGEAIASGTSITYTPPTFSGWNRLVYILSHDQKPSEDKMGTVYVTISESANRPPTIPNREYNYNAEQNKVVKAGESINIDLSTIGITEPDNQDWQLIAVQSIGATVGAGDPSSVLNKVITFQAANAGRYDISYIVGDHYGGYSFGIIRVTVSVNEQHPSWNSMYASNKYIDFFIAPNRYSDALFHGFKVTPLWDSTVHNTIAGYDDKTTKLFCSTIGYVPSISKMNVLRENHYTTSSNSNTGYLNEWPTGKTYLIRNNEDTDYVSYNITNGEVTTYNPSERYYVTCILNENALFTQVLNNVVANNVRTTVATLVKQPTTNVSLHKLPTGHDDDLSDDDVQMRLVGKGAKLRVTTQATKAGVYMFNGSVSNGDLTNHLFVNYIADVSTPKLAYKINANKAPAWTLESIAIPNMVTATLTDAYGNLLIGKKITVQLRESGLVENSAAVTTPANNIVTDNQGNIQVSLINNEAEDVTLVFTMSDSDIVINTNEVTVTFLEPETVIPMCGGINDTDKTNATGACLKVIRPSNGWLFSSPPSIALMDLLGYTIDIYDEIGTEKKTTYREVLYETGEFGPVNGAFAGFMATKQASQWCKELNKRGFMQRTNWYLPSYRDPKLDQFAEIKKGANGTITKGWADMGWPTKYFYADAYKPYNYYLVNIFRDDPEDFTASYGNCTSDYDQDTCSRYVSCLSKE